MLNAGIGQISSGNFISQRHPVHLFSAKLFCSRLLGVEMIEPGRARQNLAFFCYFQTLG